MMCERRINRLPLHTPWRAAAGNNHKVTDENRPAVRVGGQQAILPLQNGSRGVGIEFKIDDDIIQTTGAEQIEVIVVIAPIAGAARKTGSLRKNDYPTCRNVVHAIRRLIVIADRNAIGNAFGEVVDCQIFRNADGRISDDPFCRIAAFVAAPHAITDMGNINDVRRVPVGSNPLRLRIKILRCPAEFAAGIVFRVR